MQKNHWAIFILLAFSIIGCTQEQIDKLLYTNKQQKVDQFRNDSLRTEKLCEVLTNRLLDESQSNLLSRNGLTHLSNELLEVYSPASFEQLRWQNMLGETASQSIAQYIDYLRKAETYGLSPTDYNLPNIENLYQKVYPPIPEIDTTTSEKKQEKPAPKPPKDLQEMIELDLALSQSYLQYTSDLFHGKFRPVSRNWEIAKREKTLGKLLHKALNNNEIEISLEELKPVPDNYQALADHLQKYLDIAASGKWKPLPKGASFRKGSSSEDILQLAQNLSALGDLPASKANSNTFDEDFTKAIKNYQARHGLAETGLMDASTIKSINIPIEDRIELLKLNLNRYRWLPDDLGERYVWANIPEFMIYVYDGEKRTTEIVSVVGEYKNMTPILMDKPMQNIIFSPTWTIPRSIAKEEMEYIKKNPGVLIVADVEVFYKGKKTNPYKINWNTVNLKDVRLKQKPKNTNSMGRAKFMFANNHSIYLHDTPNKIDFKKRVRNFSHGCLRVGNPALFAESLLEGSGSWNNQKIKSAMFSGKERFVKPPKKTKVHVVYFTAWADDDGKLQFRRDIYGHDKRQLKLMGVND